MIELAAAQARVLAPLFKSFTDTMVLSYLQGHFGRGLVDEVDTPTCGFIKVGDVGFIAGNADAQCAETLARGIPDGLTLMIPENAAWGALLKRVYGDQCSVLTRYAIKKEPHCFDRVHLGALARALPEGFSVRRIDEALYARILAMPDIIDLCSLYRDAADYVRRGIGFVALHGDQIAGGASSYTVYDGGIEIQIDTREQFRRRGLATACAATLILTCLDEGRYPSWDAANMASVKLAEKLGYHLDREYDTYLIQK